MSIRCNKPKCENTAHMYAGKPNNGLSFLSKYGVKWFCPIHANEIIEKRKTHDYNSNK